jgi:succinoglycan biosynthesis protein ExoL
MSQQKRIAFFAHERGDARVMKRIAALRDLGWEVTGFTFHRDRGKPDVPPFWENVDLGTTYNRRYFQRLWALAKAITLLWKYSDRLAECGVIYVINTDNALLALAGRWFSGRSIPLALELADIQPAMTGTGLISRGLRSIERWVLAKTSLLVTTSPGFVRNYFEPVQRYQGPIFLLENKVYPSGSLPAPPHEKQPVHGGKPWVIGCFGALRCRRSLEIMRSLSDQLPGEVRFVLRGYAAGTIAAEFPQLIEGSAGIVFRGPYRYPDDLAEMYGEVDFNWCFDESDPTGNSAWLLPNRIYEGGCYHVPALGAKGTETGGWIAENQCGWQIEEPLGDNLATFFRNLAVDEWLAVATRCGNVPGSRFRGESDYMAWSDRLLECSTRS